MASTRRIYKQKRITKFNTEWWICENCREHGIFSGELPETCHECGSSLTRKMTARDWKNSTRVSSFDSTSPPLDAA